jgi:hypothetical protein
MPFGTLAERLFLCPPRGIGPRKMKTLERSQVFICQDKFSIREKALILPGFLDAEIFHFFKIPY